MDTTDHAQGYGKFEETARELEQAAGEKAEAASKTARRSGPSRMAALSAAVRTRPVSSMLMACVVGYLVGWRARD